jgi:hypothetical protein
VRVIRSWPEYIPRGRAYVIDDLDRLTINNCDYSTLRRFDDDILLIEWDIAVSREDLRTFGERAQDDPGRVLVAPYRLYPDSYLIDEPIWAHRHWNGDGADTTCPRGAYPIATGDPTCELFGLGMVWLPREILRAWFAARYATHFGDVEFSMWHCRYVTPHVPVCWDVHPAHLNYTASKVWES